jgi:hypothetical protein
MVTMWALTEIEPTIVESKRDWAGVREDFELDTVDEDD